MYRILVTVLGFAVLTSFGCATYQSDLDRAERHYQSNQHERALALFRVIEQDMDSLGSADRARYAYLRGINDYRMSGTKDDTEMSAVDKSFRSHARYWLGQAKAMEKQTPGSLRSEWKKNIDEALRDLNQDVYGVGVFPDDDEGSAAEGKSSSEVEEEEDDADDSDDDSDT